MCGSAAVLIVFSVVLYLVCVCVLLFMGVVRWWAKSCPCVRFVCEIVDVVGARERCSQEKGAGRIATPGPHPPRRTPG